MVWVYGFCGCMCVMGGMGSVCIGVCCVCMDGVGLWVVWMYMCMGGVDGYVCVYGFCGCMCVYVWDAPPPTNKTHKPTHPINPHRLYTYIPIHPNNAYTLTHPHQPTHTTHRPINPYLHTCVTPPTKTVHITIGP